MHYNSEYTKKPKYFGFNQARYQKLLEKVIALISEGDEAEDVKDVHTEFDSVGPALVEINRLGFLTINSQGAMSNDYIQFPYLQVSAPLYEMLYIYNTILETPKLNSRFCCSIRYLITDKNGKTVIMVLSNRKPHSLNLCEIEEERIGLTYTRYDFHQDESQLKENDLISNNLYSITSVPLFQGLDISTWFPTPQSLSKEQIKALRKENRKDDNFLNHHYANFFICDTTFANNDMFTIFKDLAASAIA
jgi:hypothetical protein